MNATPTLKIRWDLVAALREVKGLDTDLKLARAMGINPGNLSRVIAGKQQPGPKFMASLCRALDASLNVLFEIVDEPKVAA